MDETRDAYKILVGISERRYKRRWLQRIKMAMKETTCEVRNGFIWLSILSDGRDF
jgi:hypothetical protein